jgi:hypothetical protein
MQATGLLARLINRQKHRVPVIMITYSMASSP